MGGVARAQIAIIWSYGREHLRRAWSNSVGERPATGFSLAAFALVCAMVGSRDSFFGIFLVVRGMLLHRVTSLVSVCLPLPGRIL